MKKLIICIGVSFFLMTNLAGCGGKSYFESKGQAEVEAKSREDTVEDGDADSASDEASEEKSRETPTEVYVQVSGAVVHPGVFSVSPEARVFEVIALAGGLAEDADDSDLNQAERVADGQKIYVYTVDEAKEIAEAKATQNQTLSGESEDGTANNGLVNINTASKEELMTLSGIGESKAEAIISYRQKNGTFAKIEDIKNIPGIKDGVFVKISDKICVN